MIMPKPIPFVTVSLVCSLMFRKIIPAKLPKIIAKLSAIDPNKMILSASFIFYEK